MWDTLMDLFLLLAIGGWLMLWLLRERGHFGIRRGMATAPRPTDPSSPRGGAERTVPDGDLMTRQSPKNPDRRHGKRFSERPQGPGRPHGRRRQRSSHLQAGSQQPSASPSSTKTSRSNP